MDAQTTINSFGGRAPLSRILGLNYTVVDYWFKQNKIPRWWLSPIERAAEDKGISITPAKPRRAAKRVRS